MAAPICLPNAVTPPRARRPLTRCFGGMTTTAAARNDDRGGIPPSPIDDVFSLFTGNPTIGEGLLPPRSTTVFLTQLPVRMGNGLAFVQAVEPPTSFARIL